MRTSRPKGVRPAAAENVHGWCDIRFIQIKCSVSIMRINFVGFGRDAHGAIRAGRVDVGAAAIQPSPPARLQAVQPQVV